MFYPQCSTCTSMGLCWCQKTKQFKLVLFFCCIFFSSLNVFSPYCENVITVMPYFFSHILISWMLLLWGSFSFIIRQTGSCCRLDFLCPQTASSLFHKLQIFYPLLSKITFHILSNLFLCGSLILSNAIFSSFI